LTVILTDFQGKKIVRQSITTTVLASGDTGLNTTMNDLERAEYVIQYNFSLNPAAGANRSVTQYGTSITGNVVGVTVNVGLGTTLTGEVIASGY
jgi:hypothetical protein